MQLLTLMGACELSLVWVVQISLHQLEMIPSSCGSEVVEREKDTGQDRWTHDRYISHLANLYLWVHPYLKGTRSMIIPNITIELGTPDFSLINGYSSEAGNHRKPVHFWLRSFPFDLFFARRHAQIHIQISSNNEKYSGSASVPCAYVHCSIHSNSDWSDDRWNHFDLKVQYLFLNDLPRGFPAFAPQNVRIVDL